MTLYIPETGTIEVGPPTMTELDLIYAIGLCTYRRRQDSVSLDELADAVSDQALQDENFWTTNGLDPASVAHHTVRFRLEEMHHDYKDNAARYVAGMWFINDETCRLLEAIHDEKPILSSGTENTFTYYEDELEIVNASINNGRSFMKRVQKHVDRKRGFTVKDGVEKPFKEKRKGFLQNLLSIFMPARRTHKNDAPTL